MATTYDKASLVMIPSGVKESKLYSIKPTDGSGDFTFSRGTDTATRVNSSGLIEKERSNQILHSNDFTNAAWIKSAVNVTGSQTDPNGGSTAALFQNTATSNAYVYQVKSGAATCSVYAKAGTRSTFVILNGIFNNGASFDLSAETTSTSGAGVISKIEDVGGDWYRCSVYVTSKSNFLIGLSDISGGGSVIGDNMTFAFPQSEPNSIVATDYIETTTAAVYEGITDNLPRLDYSGGASCPSLLLEPSRSNLIYHSEYLDGAPFKSRLIVTDNATTSPEGVQNAGKIVATSVSGSHALDYIPSVIATDYSMSIYAKAGELSKFVLLTNNRGTNMARGFDVSNGTTFANDLGYGEPTSYSIEAVGNDWYYCTIQFPKTSAGTAGMGVYLNNDSGNYSFVGNDVDGMYFWGWQAELGSYPTSYIPTYGTSASRAADSCEVTGASDLIGETEGTIAGEFTFKSTEGTNRLFSISGADWNTIGHIRFDMISLRPQAKIRSTGADIAEVIGTEDIAIGSVVKFAVVYTSTTFKMFVNGAQIGSTDTLSGSLPSPMNEIVVDALGGAFSSPTQNNQLNPYKQALVFKTALTDAEAIALTTI